MRILHVIKALGRGGAEVLLSESLKVADRARFDFSYLTLQNHPNDMVNDLRGLDARVGSLGLGKGAGFLLGPYRLAKHLRREAIDLVHAHLPLAGFVARVAGRLADVPVVYTEHGPPHHYHPVSRRLNFLTWGWQELAIAISDDVAASIVKHAGHRVPVVTVWNGVNTRHFDPTLVSGTQVREQLGIPMGSPVIGTVAVFRDTPEKRLDIWIDAARRVLDSEPSTHFLLVGEGPLRSALEQRARRLGITKVTHFSGKQTDVRPYLAAMDVFMMSSAFEGFGIAPAEAMAMEIPVVATDVEGLRNVITPGMNGLLAGFDDQVATNLSSLAVILLRDPVRRRELGVTGRQTVLDRFSMERMQGELEDIYEGVLARIW